VESDHSHGVLGRRLAVEKAGQGFVIRAGECTGGPGKQRAFDFILAESMMHGKDSASGKGEPRVRILV
jgi:hypothetical protein